MDPRIKAIYASFLTGAKLNSLQLDTTPTSRTLTLTFGHHNPPKNISRLLFPGVFEIITDFDYYRYQEIYTWTIWIHL